MVKSPGPKYTIEERRPKGFSFGLAARYRGKKIFSFKLDNHRNYLHYSLLALDIDVTLGPGPKYKLSDVPRGPFFSLKWRTKTRKIDETPGPYYVKSIADAPAFSMYV